MVKLMIYQATVMLVLAKFAEMDLLLLLSLIILYCSNHHVVYHYYYYALKIYIVLTITIFQFIEKTRIK